MEWILRLPGGAAFKRHTASSGFTNAESVRVKPNGDQFSNDLDLYLEPLPAEIDCADAMKFERTATRVAASGGTEINPPFGSFREN